MKTYNLKLNSIEIKLSEEEVQNLLNQLANSTHKRKYFVPKLGEEYWYIGYSGEGCVYKDIFGSRMFELILIDQGNCFATEQDAQDELNRRQALVRIWNNYDDKYSWDIDWEDDCQYKYEITYNHRTKKIAGETMSTVIANTELPYFKSAEDRNQFVESNKEDLLTIFNIKK